MEQSKLLSIIKLQQRRTSGLKVLKPHGIGFSGRLQNLSYELTLANAGSSLFRRLAKQLIEAGPLGVVVQEGCEAYVVRREAGALVIVESRRLTRRFLAFRALEQLPALGNRLHGFGI